VARVRDEVRFASPAALVKQIQHDIVAARGLLDRQTGRKTGS